MQDIYPGSMGDDVLVARYFLERLLAVTTPWHPLTEGGSFDEDMRRTLAEFQRERGIRYEKDYVGAATWDAIGLTSEIDHHVGHAPPDGSLRNWWAAAAIATSYRRLAHESDFLARPSAADDGLARTPVALAAFAEGLGWTVRPTDRHLRALTRHLGSAPVIVVGDYAHALEGPYLHAVVLSGLWSAGDIPDSLVRMHNPHAPGRTETRLATIPGLSIGPVRFEPRAILTRDAAPAFDAREAAALTF